MNFGEWDFDNDGVNDQAKASGQFLGGGMLRVRHVGIGAFARANSLEFCVAPDGKCPGLFSDPNRIRLALQEYTLAGGYSFFDDGLVVAAGLVMATGTIQNELELWGYRGFGPQLGILVRPTSPEARSSSCSGSSTTGR
ncbi:MAG: hypothetical protein IRZ16_06035 [Myxococcaceae bacterium]|nr:hypothetical protein [Myxococcaceae bacterium]